jgi:DNA-directed RNA polymerase subunit RPC12/RpoP
MTTVAPQLHVGCGGTWEPARQWSARYRCDRCHAIGLKEKLLSADAQLGLPGVGALGIRPYLCAKRVDGGRCGGWAVRKVKVGAAWKIQTKEWRCARCSTEAEAT